MAWFLAKNSEALRRALTACGLLQVGDNRQPRQLDFRDQLQDLDPSFEYIIERLDWAESIWAPASLPTVADPGEIGLWFARRLNCFAVGWHGVLAEQWLKPRGSGLVQSYFQQLAMQLDREHWACESRHPLLQMLHGKQLCLIFEDQKSYIENRGKVSCSIDELGRVVMTRGNVLNKIAQAAFDAFCREPWMAVCAAAGAMFLPLRQLPQAEPIQPDPPDKS